MRKKIIFLAVALMCFASFSKAAENLNIYDFTIKVGETLTMPLELTNTTNNLTSFEITVELPDGLTVDVDNCVLTDRYSGMLVVKKPYEGENVYRFCGLDVELGVIAGTSGALIEIPVTASQTFRGGKGQIIDSYFVTTDRERIEVKDVVFNVGYEIPAGSLMGDANADGVVDISDVLVTVDYILGKNPNPFDFANADMDKTGQIDISDVLMIVDKILGKI